MLQWAFAFYATTLVEIYSKWSMHELILMKYIYTNQQEVQTISIGYIICTTVGIYYLFIMKTNLHKFSTSIKKMQLSTFTTADIETF